MPLLAQVMDRKTNSILLSKFLPPGSYPGTVSNNKDGARELYIFECVPDDTSSRLCRSTGGVDIALSNGARLVRPENGLELVRTLRKGERCAIDLISPSGAEIKLLLRHI